MKYGVVVYKDAKNIGDDIQSYAAAQLLPQVDYYIDRESLDIFRPEDNEPVNVIVNGWLMYNKLGWPISSYINPLYLSIHFWCDDILDIGSSFLEGIGGEDLREHQPIGCRDLETQKFLEEAGFETWLSGCVTLTLKAKFSNSERDDYICLTDVDTKVEEYVRKRYPGVKVFNLLQESPTLIDKNMSWEERFSNVEKLLTIYQNARSVVTTRLHCALPCLALGTPVLLLREESIVEQGRFSGLEKLTYHATTKNFVEGNIEYDLLNPPQNPMGYIFLRDNIKEKVNEFINESEKQLSELKLRTKKYDNEWEKRALWKDRQIVRITHLAIERWKNNHSNMETLQQGKDWLEQQYFNYLQQNAELEQQQKNLQKFNTELQHDNSKLQKRNDELFEINCGLELSLKKANNEIERLSQEIAVIRDSYSWRLGWMLTTLPRKMLTLIRNIRK